MLFVVNVTADSVRRNPRTTNASDKEIDAVIGNWLKYSKDREGGRANRGKQQPTLPHESARPPSSDSD